VPRPALLLFAAVSLLYLSFPTQNYYWDGIFFAQIIEEDPGGLWYLHPNHLLYNPLGRGLWLALNAVGANLRAVAVLQVLSSLTGAAAVAVMFRVLLELGTSRYAALCLSLVFAFSATWWKFATDASSYVPATFLLTVCLWLLVLKDRPRFVLTGLTHALAMLLHQLAVLFYPAAVLGLWLRTAGRPRSERLKGVAVYTLTAAVPTLVVYVLAFAIRVESFGLREFARWLASYSPDAAFSFALGKNVATSLIGHVRLIFGGNIRLVTEQRALVSMVAVMALAVTLLILIRRLLQAPPQVPRVPEDIRRWWPMIAVWSGVYIMFLVVWLPHNTFYRVFYLPALVVFLAGFAGEVRTKYNRLALGVAALFLLNFGFHIYPQSQPGTNPSVVIADQMRGVWKPGDVVYWDVYAADNRTIRYFSPEVVWKELWGRAYINLLEDSFAHFEGLWIDSVALTRFRRQDPAFEAWLLENIRVEESYEFPVGDHVVGFAKLAKK
jgi:hypothetical protein